MASARKVEAQINSRRRQELCDLCTNIGGQNTYAGQKAERVNEDMALAPRDFLARIEALRINR